MGSLSSAQWPSLTVCVLLILPALIAIQTRVRRLNLLQLGEEDAHYMGIDVKRTQRQLLVLSALLVGTAVSVSGIIGFVGLVVPHVMCFCLDSDHRWMLPGEARAGAILLLADALARTW